MKLISSLSISEIEIGRERQSQKERHKLPSWFYFLTWCFPEIKNYNGVILKSSLWYFGMFAMDHGNLNFFHLSPNMETVYHWLVSNMCCLSHSRHSRSRGLRSSQSSRLSSWTWPCRACSGHAGKANSRLLAKIQVAFASPLSDFKLPTGQPGSNLVCVSGP
jgi:hypothetical protein